MSTMIVNAQLLLNTHRTCHGLIEHYYGAVKNVLYTLGKRLEGQPSMVHRFYQSVGKYLRESVSDNKNAGFRLEHCFLGSVKPKGSATPRKHLKLVENRPGLTLPLSDCCVVLKDQSKMYKGLREKTLMVKYYLYMVLMDYSAKENPDAAKSIHPFIEGLTEPLIVIKGICQNLKILEDCAVNGLQKQNHKGFVNGMGLLIKHLAEHPPTVQDQHQT